MNAERRHSKRLILDTLLYFDLEPNNGGIVLDLSEGGMQISAANPLTSAKEIHFSFCLEVRKRIHGTGQIAWISPSGKSAGVCFLSLPEKALGQIRKFLSRNATAGQDGNGTGTTTVPTAAPELPVDPPLPAPVGKPPEPQPAFTPPVTDAIEPPTVLSLYDRDGLGETSSSLGTAAETEPRVAEGGESGDWKTSAFPSPSDSAEGQPTIRFFLDRFPKLIIPSQQRREAKKAATPAPPKSAPTQPPKSRPAPRPEARAAGAARGTWVWGQPPNTERAEAEQPPARKIETWRAPTPVDSQVDEPLPPGGPLYLPNYQLEEDRATGNVRFSKFQPTNAPQVAAKLMGQRFEEFGWALERDWHIWVALVLLLAGFLALAQKPPLLLLTVALWFASAMFMLGRKKSKRPPAEPTRPSGQ